MPLLRRKRVLAAKIESTSGTAESLANADAAFNAFDVEIQVNSEQLEREGQGSFSSLPSVPGPRGGTLSFKTNLFGDGAAGTPGWASTLLPACGYVESTGTFSPTTEAPGSNVKTLTMAVYEDGVKKTLRGAAGTFQITAEAGKLVMLEWTFTGVWVAPTDVAILTPTYPTISPLRFVSTAYTLGGSTPPCTNSLTIDAGNTVILRPCPTPSDSSGYETALITARKPMLTIDPESQLVATNDFYGDWLSMTEQACSLALTDGTDTITIAAPKAQHLPPQEAERSDIQVDTLEFQLNRSASAGDDELTIDFS